MSTSELLGRVVRLLDAAVVPYMITGSFASTYYGVPRSTHDIDIVIDPTRATLDALLVALPETEYYVDPQVAREALVRRSQFNVIDFDTGWKIDLIIRKARAFSVEEFRRRHEAELLGVRVFVATVEDSIVAKLEWAKLGDSDRQLRDVEGMLAARAATMDVSYVERWVDELGLEAQWARVRGK
ncbi:MAG: hypothetical protein AB7O24_02655 [Kofleriaceae bacterium]